MSEKGIIKLVTIIAVIVGITIISVALILKGEIEAAVAILMLTGVGYIVLQVIKKV